jgi:hypothetical protein
MESDCMYGFLFEGMKISGEGHKIKSHEIVYMKG